MAVKKQAGSQSRSSGGGSSADLTRNAQAMVDRVLKDPSLYPDEFKAWLPRWLYGNINFTILGSQLPTIESKHLVGATGEVAFGGAWANYGGTNQPALYWKDFAGMVWLGGIVKSGAVPSTIFTLPAGYRPQYAMIFAVIANGAFGVCAVNPDGTVVANSGSSTYFSLSGIAFRQYS